MKDILTTKKIIRILSSKEFFWFIVGLLVVQALWIAFTARYPMAFDEDFHLGIIRLYSEHILPFWTSTPQNSEAFGAVTRDPSYMFHYLLSFPYRLLDLLGATEYLQVIFLRVLNITFFVAGLFIYRNLLLRIGASKAVAHLTLLVFVLIPISPFLAAQINYDNLILPLTALALLLALDFIKNSSKKHFDTKTFILIFIVSLFAGLVKYPFLPIFAAITVYLLVYVFAKYSSLKELFIAIKAGFKKMSVHTSLGLILLVTLTGGIFIERYAVNTIKYGNPIPDCAEVLDYEQCKNYGPWIRDYTLEANIKTNNVEVDTNPIKYTQHWIYGMWFRSFFAVDGPSSGFATRGPLVLPGMTAVVAAIAGIAAFIFAAPKIWKSYRKPAILLFGLAITLHVLILWSEEFRLFLQTGHPVAINGRYLLPILPMIILLAALGFKELTLGKLKLQIIVTILLIFGFAWGGGSLTYILRSDDAWYWQNNNTVKSINYFVKDSIGPVIPGNSTPQQFLH